MIFREELRRQIEGKREEREKLRSLRNEEVHFELGTKLENEKIWRKKRDGKQMEKIIGCLVDEAENGRTR